MAVQPGAHGFGGRTAHGGPAGAAASAWTPAHSEAAVFLGECVALGAVLGFLAELVMAECDDRTHRRAERRIRAAGFPRPKRLEEFDFAANPAINPATIGQLAAGDWIRAGQPLCLIGDSGTGKTHIALGLGLAACQRGLSVGFTTASALVSEMMEARDERRLLRLQKQMAGYKLLIIDELGFVPLSKTGAELLFELILDRHS